MALTSRRLLLACVACWFGCSGPRGGAQAPRAGECAVELAPRLPPDLPAPTPERERAHSASQIVVHVEHELAPIAAMIEARVPRRVSEGRFGIGLAGTVSYEAERGALSVSVAHGALVIETPVRARAEACRGASCYASCAPEALVRAEVPLLLRSDYRFERARVSLRFTRGCKVRALGGLLTVDVTPTLQSHLEPQLERIGHDIDRQLPDLRGEAEKAWIQAFEPRPLPLLGCFVLAPEGVAQGPIASSTRVLRARFALHARPELRASCTAALGPTQLPPLQRDPSMAEEGVVRLGMVTELETLARALARSTPSIAPGEMVTVRRALISAHGSDVALDVSMAGAVCGDLALMASPDFSGDGQWIGLSRATGAASERKRLAEAGLDATGVLRALAAAPRLAPPLSVAGFRTAVPALAATLSHPSLRVSAEVSSAQAGGAVVRRTELVAWLEARGSLTFAPRTTTAP